MRDYARQRLVASGDEAAQRSRHAHALAELARRAAAAIIDQSAKRADAGRARQPARGHCVVAGERTRARRRDGHLRGVASPRTAPGGRRRCAGWSRARASSKAARVAALACPLVARVRAPAADEPRPARTRNGRARARTVSRARRRHGRILALGNDRAREHRGQRRPRGNVRAMRALLARHPEWPLSVVGVAGRRRSRRLRAVAATMKAGCATGCWSTTSPAAATGKPRPKPPIPTSSLRCSSSAATRKRWRAAAAILESGGRQDSRNAAYAWNGLSRHAAGPWAFRRVPRCRAARRAGMRKHGLPLLTDHYAVLLAEEGRAHDAARMIGHAHSAYQACGMARGARTDNRAQPRDAPNAWRARPWTRRPSQARGRGPPISTTRRPIGWRSVRRKCPRTPAARAAASAAVTEFGLHPPALCGLTGCFTLAVSNVEEEATRLKKLNIDTSQRTSGEKVKTLMITDPDGNHIAFAEATDPSLAR